MAVPSSQPAHKEMYRPSVLTVMTYAMSDGDGESFVMYMYVLYTSILEYSIIRSDLLRKPDRKFSDI